MTALLCKNTTWVWSIECQTAFEKLVDMLCNAPLLQLPDFELPFVLISDASLKGTGAVLLQNDKPVAYTSAKFSSAEVNYTTTEQELLGVIRALQEWRCYLEGGKHPVTLTTDHNPLVFLRSQKTLSRRQGRWVEYLERFDHTWKYIPGRTNVADPLSRNPVLNVLKAHQILACEEAQPSSNLCVQIKMGYLEDVWFNKPHNTDKLTLAKQGLWRLGIKKPSARIVVPQVDTILHAIL